METTFSSDEFAVSRRQLIVRDSLSFLVLALITLALFAATLFLFRSFTAHRAVLAVRWLDRGKADLAHGRAVQAVTSLQIAMDYAPGDRGTELLLAQALGDAGHTEESTNYLSELWETEPGSGLINLRLARLAAKKQEQLQAINYYRAAIYGTWEGDGVERRRDTRLELARYLLAQNDPEAARVELLVASGNTIGDPAVDLTIGGLLEQANDPQDALRLYRRAAETRPGDAPALAAAGRVAFRAGDYRDAQHWLAQALHSDAARNFPASDVDPTKLSEMLRTSEQIVAMTPSSDLPSAERVRRILHLREIAYVQLESCVPRLNPDAAAALHDLVARWAARDANPSRGALLRSVDLQNALVTLSYQTALALSTACSVQPEDEQQPLLLLARHPGGFGN